MIKKVKNITDKSYNVKDVYAAHVVSEISSLLIRKGMARVSGFGVFKISKIKGRKRWDFKKKKAVPVESFKTIVFTSAEGLREKLNKK